MAVKRIAIGDPKTVPAGEYAMQVLTALKVADKLGDRVVYGTNVRQVLAYVENRDVSAGIVYATDAKQAGDKVKVVAMARAETHEAIVYPVVVLAGSKHADLAGKFLRYLEAEKAGANLRQKAFWLESRAGLPNRQQRRGNDGRDLAATDFVAGDRDDGDGVDGVGGGAIGVRVGAAAFRRPERGGGVDPFAAGAAADGGGVSDFDDFRGRGLCGALAAGVVGVLDGVPL